ncbi:MAG: hypothetical protein IVW56_09560 [Candidatus Binataceae bacterium]|nr:hypothetical protein [Candidatus Binataceae bacterium]
MTEEDREDSLALAQQIGALVFGHSAVAAVAAITAALLGGLAELPEEVAIGLWNGHSETARAAFSRRLDRSG